MTQGKIYNDNMPECLFFEYYCNQDGQLKCIDLRGLNTSR